MRVGSRYLRVRKLALFVGEQLALFGSFVAATVIVGRALEQAADWFRILTEAAVVTPRCRSGSISPISTTSEWPGVMRRAPSGCSSAWAPPPSSAASARCSYPDPRACVPRRWRAWAAPARWRWRCGRFCRCGTARVVARSGAGGGPGQPGGGAPLRRDRSRRPQRSRRHRPHRLEWPGGPGARARRRCGGGGRRRSARPQPARAPGVPPRRPGGDRRHHLRRAGA